MLKHTHIAILTRQEFGGEYKDSFLFTPSTPDAARAEALSRITKERNVAEDHFVVKVTELPNAAYTRANGRMLEINGRYVYEI